MSFFSVQSKLHQVYDISVFTYILPSYSEEFLMSYSKHVMRQRHNIIVNKYKQFQVCITVKSKKIVNKNIKCFIIYKS